MNIVDQPTELQLFALSVHKHLRTLLTVCSDVESVQFFRVRRSVDLCESVAGDELLTVYYRGRGEGKSLERIVEDFIDRKMCEKYRRDHD